MYNIKITIEDFVDCFEGSIFLENEYIGRCFTRGSGNHLNTELIDEKYMKLLSEITKHHFKQYPPIFDTEVCIDEMLKDLIFYERAGKIVMENEAITNKTNNYLLVITANKRYVFVCDRNQSFIGAKKYLAELFKKSKQRIKVMMITPKDITSLVS